MDKIERPLRKAVKGSPNTEVLGRRTLSFQVAQPPDYIRTLNELKAIWKVSGQSYFLHLSGAKFKSIFLSLSEKRVYFAYWSILGSFRFSSSSTSFFFRVLTFGFGILATSNWFLHVY